MEKKTFSSPVDATFAAIKDTLVLVNAMNTAAGSNPILFFAEEKDGKLIISADTAEGIETRRQKAEEDLRQLREEQRKRQRKEWVEKMVVRYADDSFADIIVMNCTYGYVAVVVTRRKGDRYTATVGEARCAPSDTFDHDIGLAIAYARALGEEVPDFML